MESSKQTHLSHNTAFTRCIVLAGALTLLMGSSLSAQTPRSDNRGYANRTVDGTVASVVHERRGDRVRLTNGMDLLVPTSVMGLNQGRRYSASTLQPGDVVRMEVYSREGDGRDARVRSLEIVQSSAFDNRDISGTVVSVSRRSHSLVMRTDRGRMVTVDVATLGRGNSMMRGLRRGDRIQVDGDWNREGTLIAENIRGENDTRDDGRRR